MRAFTRVANIIYATKRNEIGVSQVTQAVTVLDEIYGSALMPASIEVLDQYRIQSPRQHYTVYFENSPDILPGDFLVFGGVSYPVRGINKWTDNHPYLEVLVEEIK